MVKQSPAKLNLFLKVLKKREDGYHDIISLMQQVSLYDEMCFTRKKNRGIVVKCPGSSVPEDENNIVFRAVQKLFTLLSYDGGVEIVITKKIPVAAGLGGGSSNAATALSAVNEMFQFGCSQEELMAIGAKLGADIPFFLFGKTALASGSGVQIEVVKQLPPLVFVLINLGIEISTKEVYENLKLGLTNKGIEYNIPRLTTVTQVAGALYNDLEKVSLRFYPILTEIKNLLRKNGALGSLMSGSGPTVFGVFRDLNGAKKAEENLTKLRVGSVYTVQSI